MKQINDIKIIVDGVYKSDDILFCECKLKYSNSVIQYDNIVYCEKRSYLIDDLKLKLNNKMPNIIYLKIIKIIGKCNE